MPSFSSSWTQFFPPKPQFTEKDVSDLLGKIYVVTGSNTGIGKELARMLYAKNAKVYIAARSQQRAEEAIADIERSAPASKGSLVFLNLDLSDLNQVKTAANTFLAQETKLNVLFNNAGLMATDPLTRTTQGYEMSLGVNCVGTFLFTKLLTPTLVATAKTESPNSVRVVWLSSFGLELFATKDTGISLDNLDYHIPTPSTERYGISKCGAWAHGVEFARRYKADGIISLPINPGNLTSELARDQPASLKIAAKVLGYPPPMGACTELFAGLSPEVTMEKSGSWVIPFGRFYPLRQDLINATKSEAEGGTGGCRKFWDWSENEVKSYL
ncbi:putative estradiol 17 beta-dehydrogenase [Clohesyomyces aquaticus]|uniref:Putative estradiol 17 beta-dehydrogenase n=1 Tax=Clohesyomyces aquaticus TaxID=1231657 RepID=A0A1Y1YXI4_9PLEO|nr:putative estradiol 17 beta-dehydrogenase [Clohesyomyces aquaticus]